MDGWPLRCSMMGRATAAHLGGSPSGATSYGINEG